MVLRRPWQFPLVTLAVLVADVAALALKNVFDVERSRKLTIETDPTVLKAIESLPKAKELLDKARQLLVQRRTR